MKTPSKKTLLIVGGIIVAIFILRMLKSRYDNRGMDAEIPTPGTTPTAGSSSSTSLSENCDKKTKLVKGQKSTCVLYAQKQFNRVYSKLGISKLTEDGIFGAKTEAAFTALLGRKTATYEEIVQAVNNF